MKLFLLIITALIGAAVASEHVHVTACDKDPKIQGLNLCNVDGLHPEIHQALTPKDIRWSKTGISAIEICFDPNGGSGCAGPITFAKFSLSVEQYYSEFDEWMTHGVLEPKAREVDAEKETCWLYTPCEILGVLSTFPIELPSVKVNLVVAPQNIGTPGITVRMRAVKLAVEGQDQFSEEVHVPFSGPITIARNKSDCDSSEDCEYSTTTDIFDDPITEIAYYDEGKNSPPSCDRSDRTNAIQYTILYPKESLDCSHNESKCDAKITIASHPKIENTTTENPPEIITTEGQNDGCCESGCPCGGMEVKVEVNVSKQSKFLS